MSKKPSYKEMEKRVKELENKVAELDRIEKELRKNEVKLEGIISCVTDHMSLIDEHHNIMWANETATRLFGANIVGKKCYFAYHGRDKICDSCVVKKTLSDGKIHEHETEVLGIDGNKMHFRRT
jgi:PAS domain-containing protein